MSRPASCKSKRSEVDETLFGNKLLLYKFLGSNRKQDAKTAKVIESIRKGDTTNPDLILIGETELLRMKVGYYVIKNFRIMQLLQQKKNSYIKRKYKKNRKKNNQQQQKLKNKE